MEERELGDYIIYADESGDHSMEELYKDYPVFVLALCIFKVQEYTSEVVKRIKNFKFSFWGHDLVVLHSAKIRKQIEEFSFLQNQNRRQFFIEQLNNAIHESPFTVISTGIDKRLLKEKYSQPTNPYELSLEYCLERVYKFLKENGQLGKLTHLILESRMHKENTDLEFAYEKIIEKNKRMQNLFPLKLLFAEKKTNNIGLQIADLVAYPIGKSLLNGKNPAFEIIKNKFHKFPDYQGKGLKIFPDQKKERSSEKRKTPGYSEVNAD